MLNMITLQAEAAATQGPAGSALFFIVYLVVIFGAMYFLLFRPQRKKQKEEKKMRESLRIGDEIITIGGIYGRVVSLKEDTIVIESQVDRSKLTIARWALQTILTVHDDTPLK
ncbi:MAG: preprotein translocase subunit YajC [Acutalibacteraceae bacterium]|jgi:preprotein translocase subunit YajC